MHVEQHDVDAVVPEQLLGELDRRRFEHSVSLELEVDAAEHSQAVVVVDDKHGGSGGPHLAASACSAEASLAMPEVAPPRHCLQCRLKAVPALPVRPLLRGASAEPRRPVDRETETNVTAVRSRCETGRREWAA